MFNRETMISLVMAVLAAIAFYVTMFGIDALIGVYYGREHTKTHP